MKTIERLINAVFHKDAVKEKNTAVYDTTEIMKLYEKSIILSTEGLK